MAPARAHLRLVRPCSHRLTTPELHALVGRALGAVTNERAEGRTWVRRDPRRAAALLGRLQQQRLIDLAEDCERYWLCADVAELERALRQELGHG
jgi:hypothetical protein